MINHEYSVYIKTASGMRGAYINDITSIDISFRWNTVTKWTLTGSSLSACPIGKGAEIVIYRGSEPFLSGFVTRIEDSFDAVTDIYDWYVEGQDDLGKLSWRVAYPDPADADIQIPDRVYCADGYFTDILLDIIAKNACLDADLTARRIATLKTQTREHLGDSVTISAEYDVLSKKVLGELENGSFGIRSVWDGETGLSTVELYTPNDVHTTVVFSVESGNLAGWKRKRIAPKANALLVIGVEVTNEDDEGTGVWQTVYIEDAASIALWGRREMHIEHGDIKRIIEEDDDGNVISKESWESVQARLQQAAENDMIKNSGQDGYELSIVELDRMQYKVNWDLGDIVSVRIGDTEMVTPIKEVKINYSGGVETITPSVGELQKGELEGVFGSLDTLNSQVKILQSR